MTHKGTHIFFDFEDFDESNHDEKQWGTIIFNIMIDSIKKLTNMTIVHSKLIKFSKEEGDEPGFTSVLLLDESHFTAHAYTAPDKALLAMDLFTCGKTDTEKVAEYVINRIKEEFKNIKINKYVINKRFNKNNI